MSFKIEGTQEAVNFMRSLARLVPANTIGAVSEVAQETMRQGAGSHSPRVFGTGRLYASLFNRSFGVLGREVGHDGAIAPHAQWVIFGSVPHWIVPRRAKMLRWFPRFGGPPVFAKRVWHPGYVGDNYVDRAAEDALAGMAAIVDRTLKEVA